MWPLILHLSLCAWFTNSIWCHNRENSCGGKSDCALKRLIQVLWGKRWLASFAISVNLDTIKLKKHPIWTGFSGSLNCRKRGLRVAQSGGIRKKASWSESEFPKLKTLVPSPYGAQFRVTAAERSNLRSFSENLKAKKKVLWWTWVRDFCC